MCCSRAVLFCFLGVVRGSRDLIRSKKFFIPDLLLLHVHEMNVLDDCIGVDVLPDIRLLPLLMTSQLLLLLNLNHLHDIGPFLRIHLFELILHVEQHLCRCVSMALHLLRGERRQSAIRLSQD